MILKMAIAAILMAPEDEKTGSGSGASLTGEQGGDKGEQGSKGGTGTTEKPAESGASLIGDEQNAGEKKGEKTGEGEAKAKETSTEIKLKLPDGVSEDFAKPYVDLAKKHGLKQEAAQEFFDRVVGERDGAVKGLEKQITDTWAKTQKDWLDKARTDLGDKFKESVGLADKAIRKLGGDDLMKVVRDSGLGKRVEIIRAFAEIGKMVSEDNIGGSTGSTGKAGPTSERARLKAEFPNSPVMWEHLPE